MPKEKTSVFAPKKYNEAPFKCVEEFDFSTITLDRYTPSLFFKEHPELIILILNYALKHPSRLHHLLGSSFETIRHILFCMAHDGLKAGAQTMDQRTIDSDRFAEHCAKEIWAHKEDPKQLQNFLSDFAYPRLDTAKTSLDIFLIFIQKTFKEKNLGNNLKHHFPLGLILSRNHSEKVKAATSDIWGILFNLFKCNFDVVPALSTLLLTDNMDKTSGGTTLILRNMINTPELKDNVEFVGLIRSFFLASASIDIREFTTKELAALHLEKALHHPMLPHERNSLGSYCHRMIANERWHKTRGLFNYFLNNNIFEPALKDQLGTTLLAMLCKFKAPDELVDTYFEICKKMNLDPMVDAEDNKGWRPLHWAVMYGSSYVVKLLLAHKANPYLKNTSNKTPLDALSLSQEDYEKSLRDALNSAELFPDRPLALPTNYFVGLVDENNQRILNNAENVSCLNRYPDIRFSFDSYEGTVTVYGKDLFDQKNESLIDSLMKKREKSAKEMMKELLKYVAHPMIESILRDPSSILSNKMPAIKMFSSLEFWSEFLKTLLQQETNGLLNSSDVGEPSTNEEKALEIIKNADLRNLSQDLKKFNDAQLNYIISTFSPLFTKLFNTLSYSKENATRFSTDLLVILALCDDDNDLSLKESKATLTDLSATVGFWSGKIPAATSPTLADQPATTKPS